MSSKSANVAAVRKALETRMDFATWLATLGSRDRVNVERPLTALEAVGPTGTAHAALWRRLAQTLATLAPFAATTTGQQAVSFFVADGKSRMTSSACKNTSK